MKIKKYMAVVLALGLSIQLTNAQTETQKEQKEEKAKKAWEIGVGGSVFQFNRVAFTNFEYMEDGGYNFGMQLRHAVYGGNIYAARELSKHFYLDFQGGAGLADKIGGNKSKWFYNAGLGLQWRLGEYFGSKYIDPYLRVGAGYMYKDFLIDYSGAEGLPSEEMKWVLENICNKDGADKKNLLYAPVGVGVNMWLNDRLGIGVQGDYLVMPYKDVANSLQGTVRLMWRFGGKSKKAAPKVQYVDRTVVEEKVVVQERVVVDTVRIEGMDNLLSNIVFDFDKATLKPESQETITKLADLLNKDRSKKYLITGYTDSKGSDQYNQILSANRAKAVINALIEKGVSQEMLKSRGVGSRIAYANTSQTDYVREGDRKVTVELITNIEYWNYLR